MREEETEIREKQQIKGRERERDVEEREKFNRIIRNMFSIFTIHLY